MTLPPSPGAGPGHGGGPVGPAAPRTADEILDALDPEQRDVAAHPRGPMCVLAGAGTGKTRAITHRVAYGVLSGAYPPQRVLAVTFTARAAGEMRTRLRQLGVVGVQARTFHAAALRQLHYFWPQAIGGAAPEVLPAKAGVVAEAVSRLRMDFDRTAIRDLAGEIEWAKVSMLTPESYAVAAARARRDPAGIDLTAMSRVFAEYESCKEVRGVIDFEDVLLLTLGILADRPDIAAQVRAQYRHFVVDEYQDVNALQQRLLELWLGDSEELCVVGDAAQTIYSFTGATPAHLLNFTRAHPAARVVHLVRNYRSTPQIVALANTVLRSQRSAGMPGARPGGMPGGSLVELVAEGPPGTPPRLTAYPDDVAEARGVAAAIRALVDAGTAPSRIGVLFRINAQSEAFESALADAGIAYLVRGGERFFARKEVRDALVLLRGAARADDASKPLGEVTRDVLAGAGWTREPPASAGAVRDRWESLMALAGLADELSATLPDARLPDLVRELGERAAAQHAPTVEGVTLASLHAAKGLEWDVVFLAGCSDGLLPIVLAEGMAAVEEERRLLYVGMTRARRELHLSWAAARTPGARPTRKVSRFLDAATGLLGDGAAGRVGRGDSDRRRSGKAKTTARPRTCRVCGGPLDTAAERKLSRCASCPATYDEATFERLKAWRLAVARSASVPAYVVFTDATLTAIAESGATSSGDLAQLPGIGARKIEMYAGAVLDVLAGGTGATGESDDPEDLDELP